MIFLCLCTLSLTPIVFAGLFPCRDARGCVPIHQCKEALDLLHKSSSTTRQDIELLRQSYCGFKDNTVLVCCEVVKIVNHKNKHLLPANCGFIGLDRIIGGKSAGLKQFPWMALISIRKKGGQDFACGGTIINEFYILTAAHCVNRQLLGVRVGEHDLYSEKDCEGINPRLCNEPVQDIAIETSIIHEEYTGIINSANDIALLRLKHKINLSRSNTRPVCLPTSVQELRRDLSGEIGVIAGWGYVETGNRANVLMKADVPIKSESECYDAYAGPKVPLFKRAKIATYFCAGIKNHDTCSGDSGGPLIVTGNHDGYTRYIQYGISAMGHLNCGGDTPTLYSDVPLHMSWILDNLSP